MRNAVAQLQLFEKTAPLPEQRQPFKIQLLKWVGNKQRVAPEIISYFPKRFHAYHEPFLGSAGVLGVLAPQRAFGTDGFRPLIEIWQALSEQPRKLKRWYEERWQRESIARAQPGDIIYCDPPYVDTQAILYGAQAFRIRELFESIAEAKERGEFVALSIDGTKKSGEHHCRVSIPHGLFKQEILINCGRSMLRRFQRGGEQLHDEVVKDRLLLTY